MQPILPVSRLLQGLMKPCARVSPPSMVLMSLWRTVSPLVKGLTSLVKVVVGKRLIVFYTFLTNTVVVVVVGNGVLGHGNVQVGEGLDPMKLH